MFNCQYHLALLHSSHIKNMLSFRALITMRALFVAHHYEIDYAKHIMILIYAKEKKNINPYNKHLTMFMNELNLITLLSQIRHINHLS